MLGDYSTRVSSTPSCFLRCIDLLGTLFLIKSILDLLFFFGSSHRPCRLLQCSDTTLRVRPWRPLTFPSSFQSIGSPLLIGRHLTSLRSAKLQTGRLLSWSFSFFLLDRHACYSIRQWLHGFFMTTSRSPHLHIARGLWDMGTPRSPPIILMVVLDKWVWPIRRLAYLIVGPTDMIYGP
jgi:hypothetical protein